MRLARDVLRADGMVSWSHGLMVLMSAPTELNADRFAHIHQRDIEARFDNARVTLGL